ncbi:MAG: flagellar hook-basal body complex protein FliE [Treponema sp.]|nr:flagellar hook-basal body complex protein FliE [Treponema sp.]
MQINDLGNLQMIRTSSMHTGETTLASIAGESFGHITSAAEKNNVKKQHSFENYLLDAVNKMNDQQLDVSAMEQQLITDPDSVDIHDVTTAMAKAQMSLSLAQSVIDRILTGWSEISTTR